VANCWTEGEIFDVGATNRAGEELELGQETLGKFQGAERGKNSRGAEKIGGPEKPRGLEEGGCEATARSFILRSLVEKKKLDKNLFLSEEGKKRIGQSRERGGGTKIRNVEYTVPD